MRLINCSTLQLEEFFGTRIPRYAILSHTWGGEEVSFAEYLSSHSTITTQSTTKRSGYQKILFTCQQAIKDGIRYAWIDTCCIDKSSSSELSEAINSMFTWYKNSVCCYAYLSDVSEANQNGDFSKSRWFTRGWTLQELLAPDNVIFYDQQWYPLGTKSKHAKWISRITGIDTAALTGLSDIYGREIGLGSFCVAKRMSWASARQTTRVEDTAYCLLGIFNINMPLLYGEGERAFFRLQEEIIRKIDDDSILAWGMKPEMDHPLGLIPDSVKSGMIGPIFLSDVLASSPKDFVNCANLIYAAESTSPFTLTNTGLQIQLPFVPVFQANECSVSGNELGWAGLLSCSTGSSLEFVGILLCPGGRNIDSSIRVTRARIRIHGYSYNTVVVGSRAAARSVLGTVTITRFDGSQGARGLNQGHRQILINESKALQRIGYQVESGTAWNIGEPSGLVWTYNSTLNSHAKILTIEGERRFQDMIEFTFVPCSSRQSAKFTVFMRTFNSRAIVREGNTFSEYDRRAFYSFLEHEWSQYDKGKAVIHDREGNPFHVNVKVQATRVYNHRLFEVNIDAIQAVAGAD